MADIGVSTVIRAHEDFVKVVKSVQVMFPDWEPEATLGHSEYPQNRDEMILQGESESLDTLFDSARDQRKL